MCAVQLRAHKHDLILHGRSTKHKRCSQVAGTSGSSAAASNVNVTSPSVMSVEYETTVPHSEIVPSGMVDTIVTSVGDEPVMKKQRLDEVPTDDVMQTMTAEGVGDAGTTTVIIPDDSRNGTSQEEVMNGTGEEEREELKPTQISIIRVVDKPKHTGTIYTQDNFRAGIPAGGGMRRRRGRMNAADVVRAIELNEFTGYEMLQILKSIVPKL